MLRKQAMQQQFRQRLGLIVDYPIPGGQGNTNDGNTSRRAFEVPQVFAEITGVSQDLIERLAVILTAINSTRKEIDPDKFGQYALETARLYVELYNCDRCLCRRNHEDWRNDCTPRLAHDRTSALMFLPDSF
ncbi:hypothetical protein FJT64_009059 [Amphibalanus amphitrite]|uniref:Uncharacterized protein n=1 Tax=Amphibalanus amphitrite TaxID=1232801 RepID=A0A6A4VN57_AMPAM|nr:hypothetical protein FJT64_009059 [Amphibalanus amphitrite]